MNDDFKIIKAYAFNGDDGFKTYSEYFKVKRNFVIPTNKIILIAPQYKRNAFTLNFYKVDFVYDANGVDNMIIDGENFEKLKTTAIEPAIVANIDIDFYVDFCKEKERLYDLERELKKATKEINFYMQMKTLAELNPEKYGPLVEEWKALTYKNSNQLLDTKPVDQSDNK